MAFMQDRAAALGLDAGLLWGIDEGRLLVGPPAEGSLAIGTRALGDSYQVRRRAGDSASDAWHASRPGAAAAQGSFDALLFKAMVTRNMSWYSRWGVNTDGGSGLFSWPSASAVDNVATNVARLTHRLVGDALLASTNTTTLKQAAVGDARHDTALPVSIVDAVVSSFASGRGVHALAFHHHPWLNASATVAAASAALSVCGLPPGAALAGTLWGPVGDACGNFWPAWWRDRARLNLTDYNSGWSQYGESISWNDDAEAAVWSAQLAPTYQPLADLQKCAAPWTGAADNAGCLLVTLALPPHSVALLEAVLQ